MVFGRMLWRGMWAAAVAATIWGPGAADLPQAVRGGLLRLLREKITAHIDPLASLGHQLTLHMGISMRKIGCYRGRIAVCQ